MTPDEIAQALTARFQITHNGLPTAIANSIRAAIRERDAEHEGALKKARADALNAAAALCEGFIWMDPGPDGMGVETPLPDKIRALLEEAGE